MAIFQPAEELGAGAQAMIADGALDRFPGPDIVLAQHVWDTPVGTIAIRPGIQMVASDNVTLTLHGRGGHGSKPHATVDPVVMAAATVMRLQTVVYRAVDPLDVAVVSVGSIHAGHKHNIIPANATMQLSLRYTSEETRALVLDRVERIARVEAEASGVERPPTMEVIPLAPTTVNDAEAAERLRGAFERELDGVTVADKGMATGSEDVSWFARDSGAPLVFWFWGGTDPTKYAEAEATRTIASDIPTNHSPFFAPVAEATIDIGVRSMTIAALEWLGRV